MKLEVTMREHRRLLDVTGAGDRLIVHLGDRAVPVRLLRTVGEECWRLEVDEQTVAVTLRAVEGGVIVTAGPARARVEVRRALPVPSRRGGVVGGGERAEVRAPIPGLVVDLPIEVGARVQPGQPVVVVEAMKMQMEVCASVAGRLVEIRARPGEEVAGGQVLAVVEAEDRVPVAEPD